MEKRGWVVVVVGGGGGPLAGDLCLGVLRLGNPGEVKRGNDWRMPGEVGWSEGDPLTFKKLSKSPYWQSQIREN